jgi:hypothetical protein
MSPSDVPVRSVFDFMSRFASIEVLTPVQLLYRIQNT